MEVTRKSALSRLVHLRLQPFDRTTTEGRAAERYRLAALGSGVNPMWHALGLMTRALTICWAVPYLRAERFGVWAAPQELGWRASNDVDRVLAQMCKSISEEKSKA